MSRQGVLLINLGTPASPAVRDVRLFLREFLSDPAVIDLPYLWRWCLVNMIIAPLRAKKSARAYARVWQQAGSPLLLYSKKVAKTLHQSLGEHWRVALGMRYGAPSIDTAVSELEACDTVVVLPMFPQYADATTGTALTQAKKILDQRKLNYRVIHDYYAFSPMIHAWAQTITQSWQHSGVKAPYLLLSFHGLPWRQIKKNPACGHCSDDKACPAPSGSRARCYRAQCYATALAIQKSLSWPSDRFGVSFQSRLGRLPWIGPYTDQQLSELASQGVKNLLIACPSFLVDCLESLDEIAIEAAACWQALGGESLRLVPCLQDDCAWLAQLVTPCVSSLE